MQLDSNISCRLWFLKMLILSFLFIAPFKTYAQDSANVDSITITVPKVLLFEEKTTFTLLGYGFTDSSLGMAVLQPRTKNFERLEFLGDRVLGIVTAHLLHRCVPTHDIGILSQCFEQLVSKSSLLKLYNDWDMEPSLLASSCYQPPLTGPISEKTASDIVEALMGAIYRDAGMDSAQAFGEKLLGDHYELDTEVDQTPLLRLPVATMSKIMTSIQRRKLPEFLKVMNYEFHNPKLLFDAFQHPSVGGGSFKKLDFIGVRVLALVVADKVFVDHPTAEEGLLMVQNEQLINNDCLEGIFQKWQLWRFLVKQHGGIIGSLLAPERVPNRMACNSLRAFIGAVYLDGGWQYASHVTRTLLFTDPPQGYIKPIFKLASFLTRKQESEQHDTSQDEHEIHASLGGESDTLVPNPSPHVFRFAQTPKPISKFGISQEMQDWPSLNSQKIAESDEDILATPSKHPIDSATSPKQPTYLDILKRKEPDKSESAVTPPKVQESWPALNPHKTPSADASLKQPAHHKKSNVQVWQDPKTTMMAVTASDKKE